MLRAEVSWEWLSTLKPSETEHQRVMCRARSSAGLSSKSLDETCKNFPSIYHFKFQLIFKVLNTKDSFEHSGLFQSLIPIASLDEH